VPPGRRALLLAAPVARQRRTEIPTQQVPQGDPPQRVRATPRQVRLRRPVQERVGLAAGRRLLGQPQRRGPPLFQLEQQRQVGLADRKSTRLNSSHVKISYAVFCLKKKNKE